MTFLDRLRAHIGGLVLIKTELYWYGGKVWDKNPGRICLVLDAAAFVAAINPGYALHAATPDPIEARGSVDNTVKAAYALLLIDGEPRCVWMTDVNVELLTEGDQ